MTRQRRSGPPDEERWWRPLDQGLAETELLDRRAVGKGWRPAVMVNNVERARPLGEDDASAAIDAARVARVLTGLDEGRAWHHRDAGSLIVLRSEVYADEENGLAEAHRSAWHRHAERSLDATWRERWRERDQEPGWIEARWVRAAGERSGPPGPTGSGADGPVRHDGGSGPALDGPASANVGSGTSRTSSGPTGPYLGDACDWLRIEDHTVPSGPVPRRDQERPSVTVYEHVTVWAPRRQVTVVVRHDVGLDLDDVVANCATEVARRVTDAS